MIQAQNISKIFQANRNKVYALDQVSFEIDENSFTLVKGPSGCGKSTLLFTLGGMLRPSLGEVLLQGENLYSLPESCRRKVSAKTIGFVFQSYHLIPYLSVWENIRIQNKLPFMNIDETFVNQLVDQLHLRDRLTHKPHQLSAGEKQRVAMIRSLASHPKLILADEPTGNLDPENAEIVLSFLNAFRQEGGTVVMVSHSSDADGLASQIIHLRQGKISAN